MNFAVTVCSATFILCVFFEKSYATTTCYVCDSKVTENCGVSFSYLSDTVKMHQSGCHYCTKTYVKVPLIGTEYVTRGCADDSVGGNSCIDATMEGYGGIRCSCDSFLCNDASVTRMGFVLTLVVLVVARILYY